MTAVLFTCAGQRVDIVTAFGRAGATTIASDLDPLAPALYHADHMALVPRVDDPGYIASARGARRASRREAGRAGHRHRPERRARNRDALIPALLSRRPTRFARRWRTSTSRTCSSRSTGSRVRDVAARATCRTTARFPLLVKIRDGFGSRHIYRADDANELEFFLGHTPVESMVQELCVGRGVLDRRVLRSRGTLPQRDRADDDPVEGRRVDQGDVDPRSRADRARPPRRRDDRDRRPGVHPVLPRARRVACR